jgi:hypothetical protein
MRLYCYDCYSDLDHVKEHLGMCSQFYSIEPLGIRFYIREDRLSLALLVDAHLERRSRWDYYI